MPKVCPKAARRRGVVGHRWNNTGHKLVTAEDSQWVQGFQTVQTVTAFSLLLYVFEILHNEVKKKLQVTETELVLASVRQSLQFESNQVNCLLKQKH